MFLSPFFSDRTREAEFYLSNVANADMLQRSMRMPSLQCVYNMRAKAMNKLDWEIAVDSKKF